MCGENYITRRNPKPKIKALKMEGAGVTMYYRDTDEETEEQLKDQKNSKLTAFQMASKIADKELSDLKEVIGRKIQDANAQKLKDKVVAYKQTDLSISEEEIKADTEWFKHATLVTLPTPKVLYCLAATELYEEVQGWRRRFPQYEYDKKWDCIIDSLTEGNVQSLKAQKEFIE